MDNDVLSLEKFRKILKNGEGVSIEFKSCKNELSKSVFETVCSFSNRFGGFIFLGVEEKDGVAKVTGVNPKSKEDIKRNFINVLNNPNKISPSLFLNLEELKVGKKIVLWCYVPVSSEVEFCDGKIFDRNGDADQNITKSVDLVANLFNRKSRTFFERQIFPYVKLKHLRLDLIKKAKQLALVKNESHVWKNLDNMEFFKSAGLYEENLLTGEKGFNLAAVMLFGKDDVIHSCLPAYRTDAIFRDENQDRYDDRVIVDTNLIESYEILMEFVQKHTDDKFFLVDNMNTGVRDKIAREVISNILVHREFSSSFPAKIIIDKEKIYAENWNKALTFGRLDPKNFMPYPKNPIIAKFFMNINRADSLGSGVRNLYKFTKIYCGGEPVLEEGDVFKTTIPLVKKSGASQNTENVSVAAEDILTNEEKILEHLSQNKKITAAEVADLLGYRSKTSAQKILGKLIEEGRIEKKGNGTAIFYVAR